MAAELTDEGKTCLLEQKFAGLNTTFEVMLFNSTVSASNTTVYSELAAAEISGTGYARAIVDTGGWIISGEDATYPTIAFSATGSWGTVSGYALVSRETSPRSVWVDPRSDVTVNSGGVYVVNLSDVVV